MAASHASPPSTHLDVDVVLAVLYHADIGAVDGLLVVLDASWPVCSRTDHLEAQTNTLPLPQQCCVVREALLPFRIRLGKAVTATLPIHTAFVIREKEAQE